MNPPCLMSHVAMCIASSIPTKAVTLVVFHQGFVDGVLEVWRKIFSMPSHKKKSCVLFLSSWLFLQHLLKNNTWVTWTSNNTVPVPGDVSRTTKQLMVVNEISQPTPTSASNSSTSSGSSLSTGSFDQLHSQSPKIRFEQSIIVDSYLISLCFYSIITSISADPSRRVVAIVLCKIQTVAKIQNPKSEIQNPKSKIQNPKSKIQNPKSKIQDPKSKIQNPAFGAATKRTDTTTIQNPKSKIRNPKSKIQNPRSKIQNPKSKIQNPKSKIQNPKSKIQDPKSKIQNPKSKIQTPNSKLQNPKSKIQNPNGPFGFWILEFGFGRAGVAM